MAEPEPSSDVAPPGTPRWAKAFAIVAAIVVVLFVVVLLLGGHGPSRHGASGSPALTSIAPYG